MKEIRYSKFEREWFTQTLLILEALIGINHLNHCTVAILIDIVQKIRYIYLFDLWNMIELHQTFHLSLLYSVLFNYSSFCLGFLDKFLDRCLDRFLDRFLKFLPQWHWLHAVAQLMWLLKRTLIVNLRGFSY